MTTKTELLNNGVVVATKTAAPFYSWDWTPSTSGASSLTYKRYEDGVLVFTSAAITGTVDAPAGANTAPTTTADSYSMNQDNVLTVAAPGVLANDTDAEGNPLTAILVTNGTNGVVNLSANGSFTYTPNSGYTGSDSFTYKSNDGTVDGNTVTVTIAVNTALSELALSASTFTIPKEDYKAQEGILINNINSPAMLYKNGKTYFSFVHEASHKVGVIELTPYGIRPPHFVRGSTGTFNLHDVPILHFDGNRLSIVQENTHNENPVSVHTATVDNDSLIIPSNAGTLGTTPITYTNLYKNGGKLVTFGQYQDVFPGYKHSSNGTISGTWSANIPILPLDTGEVERYQVGVNNKSLLTDMVFMSVGRNDVTPTPTWFRFNVFRATLRADGYMTYKTIDGRLISDGSPTGMTNAEAAMGLVHYTGSNTAQGYIPQPSVDAIGNFYCTIKDSGTTYKLHIWKTTETTPTATTITLPDSPTLVEGTPLQDSAVAFIMPLALDNINLFFKVSNGTRTIIRHYKSTNEGVSWTVIQDIDFGVSVLSFGTVMNYLEAGQNKNILFIAGADSPVEGTATTVPPADIFVKVGSFGTIQPYLTNNYNDLTAITEAAFNATSRFNYSIESGKITNTGTTLNTVKDQSPFAANKTALGSPVIDNATTPTFMSFDGVDDGISLSPTILLPNNNYLLLTVARADAGYINPFTISDNTSTNAFIIPSVDNSVDKRMVSSTRYDVTTVGKIIGDTPTTNGFHIYAWLYRGEGHDIPMWLDGKMQLRKIITAPSPIPFEGKYTLNNVTNVEIGRLVRTTTAHYNFQMKHISMHEITSEAQVLDRIKYLGTKYGITLLNAYR